jgi:hypothetical protein
MDQSPAELGVMTKTLSEQSRERLTPPSRAVEIEEHTQPGLDVAGVAGPVCGLHTGDALDAPL